MSHGFYSVLDKVLQEPAKGCSHSRTSIEAKSNSSSARNSPVLKGKPNEADFPPKFELNGGSNNSAKSYKMGPRTHNQDEQSIVSVGGNNKTARYICNGCNINPIMGMRYQCTSCKDFDYCEKCYQSKQHPHKFEAIDQSEKHDCEDVTVTPNEIGRQEKMEARSRQHLSRWPLIVDRVLIPITRKIIYNRHRDFE